MTKAGPHNSDLSGDEALALDYVLGILAGPDLSLARERLDRDAGFALLVSRYRATLQADPTGEGEPDAVETAPRWETWEAILARISRAEPS